MHRSQVIGEKERKIVASQLELRCECTHRVLKLLGYVDPGIYKVGVVVALVVHGGDPRLGREVLQVEAHRLLEEERHRQVGQAPQFLQKQYDLYNGERS